MSSSRRSKQHSGKAIQAGCVSMMTAWMRVTGRVGRVDTEERDLEAKPQGLVMDVLQRREEGGCHGR
jgi:hypothetical protein